MKTNETWRGKLLPGKESSVALGDATGVTVRAVDRVGNLGEIARAR
jgi:hypothetical protein